MIGHPKQEVYYTIWFKCPRGHIGLEAAYLSNVLITDDPWISEGDIKYRGRAANTRFYSMEAVRKALDGDEAKKWIGYGADYVVSKHSVETVESTLESPLEQLARTANQGVEMQCKDEER